MRSLRIRPTTGCDTLWKSAEITARGASEHCPDIVGNLWLLLRQVIQHATDRRVPAVIVGNRNERFDKPRLPGAFHREGSCGTAMLSASFCVRSSATMGLQTRRRKNCRRGLEMSTIARSKALLSIGSLQDHPSLNCVQFSRYTGRRSCEPGGRWHTGLLWLHRLDCCGDQIIFNPFTGKPFPDEGPRCASTIQMVRPLESIAANH
jgi:hypothetical protein